MARPQQMQLSLRKRFAFAALATALGLLLLEGVLAVSGLEPTARREDPFVGFASNMPLFGERFDSNGQRVFATQQNKSAFFNMQSFSREKPANGYRIFCLGGSTTYGRPYSDPTSFAGWLREFLPAANPRTKWEVINAGGISYASYRVAALMDELAEYQPDLFVIYTGHNEFLEERSYGEIREIPAPVRAAMGLLARTRIWTGIKRLGPDRGGPKTANPDAGSVLPPEVQAKLDHSAGLSLYERDDELGAKILEHYRLSLERIVEIGRASGAEVVLVTPASNLRDCTPFKSQETPGLQDEARSRVAALLAESKDLESGQALSRLKEASELDPRNAALHYGRGRLLLELGQHAEAMDAFLSARDEDVCPLRALTAMQGVVRDVARAKRVPLVDFVQLLEEKTLERAGHDIAGAEYFLDHVHPNVEGHRLLALQILDTLRAAGELSVTPQWSGAVVAEVSRRVEQSIDPAVHASALANLSLTLNWAGKNEESQRLAQQALEAGHEDATMLMMVARHASLEGDDEKALHFFRRAAAASPNSPVVRSQLGMLHSGRGDYEAAAAQFFMASLLWNDNETYQKQLAFVMGQRGHARTALRCLLKAAQLNPADQDIAGRIAALRAKLPAGEHEPGPTGISVTRHESGFPRTVAQTSTSTDRRELFDGIWTEWYPNGTLKAFAYYRAGRREGAVARWDDEGRRADG